MIFWRAGLGIRKYTPTAMKPTPGIMIISYMGLGIRMHTTPGIMIIKHVGLGIRMHTTPGTMIIDAGGFKGGPQGPLASDAALVASQPPASSDIRHSPDIGVFPFITFLFWISIPMEISCDNMIYDIPV